MTFVNNKTGTKHTTGHSIKHNWTIHQNLQRTVQENREMNHSINFMRKANYEKLYILQKGF